MDIFTDYMQVTDYTSLMSICTPFVALVICGIVLVITQSKDDTIQHTRNCNKAFHHTSVKPQNCKSYDINSGAYAKRRKQRSANKRQDGAENKEITCAASNQVGNSSTEFSIKNWLQNDIYYERDCISSSAVDVMSTCHNSGHRNSTSSEAGAKGHLNSSSSNEDFCSLSKKGTKSRQNSKHKYKKYHSTSMTFTDINKNVQAMNVSETRKECNRNNKTKIPTSAALNFRKQCTKAAALKAVLNDSKISKSCMHGLSMHSEFNSPVRSSLSSASSTTSISSSASSSASSSPTHSVNSSPTASPTACKRNLEFSKKAAKPVTVPLRQFSKLNMNEQEFVQQMKRYVIEPSLLKVYGFPVESVIHEDSVEIYKCLPKHLAEEAVTKDNQRHHRHFYGRKKCDIINECDSLASGYTDYQLSADSSIDSGHGSGESSPRFTDSDSSETCEEDSNAPILAFYTPDGVYQIFSEYCNSIDKQCVRCSKMFQVNKDGEYLSYESCIYHWGKLSNVYNGKCYINIYSCCQGEELSEGCCRHDLHVWNGVVVGINGPYIDFVHTQYKESKRHRYPKVYAIDCEMSYTGLGLEVTKVTVVGYNGALVYEHFVRPRAKIIDYNTRFSGVSEKDLQSDSNNSIKTFSEVQKDLLNLFDSDTILIGHGLDNDLRVLRLVHKTIVDTSLIFSHSTGYPYRRSLKNITKSFLKRDIQCGDMGHSSFEDSRACLELMMWKVRKDLRHWSYQ